MRGILQKISSPVPKNMHPIWPAYQAHRFSLIFILTTWLLPMGGQIIKKCVPSSGNLYHFENLKEAISSIRTIQQDEWATEANIGYDYHIAIFEDLENECLILK